MQMSFPGGTVVVPSTEDPGQVELVIRSALPVVVNGKTLGFVIGDLPIGVDMVQRLEETTRVHAGAASPIAENSDKPVVNLGSSERSSSEGTLTTLFGKSLMFLDYYDWESGAKRRVSVSLSYRPAQLYRQLSDAQQIEFRGRTLGEWAVVILLVIARFTSCSWARNACGTGTSDIPSTSPATISSASWPDRSTR
jgi:hypothetical protein